MKHQNTLTLFCGLPGSGKTRIAKQLEQQTGAVRICTDDWLASLGLDLHDEIIRERLQSRLYELAQNLLRKGVDVILEDGLWAQKERQEKRAAGKECNAQVHMHVFDLSLDEQWRRLQHRNNNLTHGAVTVSLEQLKSYQQMFELPTSAELSQFDAVTMYQDDTSLNLVQ